MWNIHYNHSIVRVVGDGWIPFCLVWYCGCSCHWCTVIVIVSKTIDIFNMICSCADCGNVGCLSIIDDSPIAYNILTYVVGLWWNCESVVDLRSFAIVDCCLYVKILAVVLFVGLILYWIHKFTKFKFKTISDGVVVMLIG